MLMVLFFKSIKKRKGQSLVELILVFALIVVLLPAITLGIVSSRDGRAQQEQRQSALELLREMDEAVRSFRRQGWVAFAQNGTYHPQIIGNNWILATGSASISGFVREVKVDDVYRDENNKITSGSGTLDPSTKKIISIVSWDKPYISSVSAVTYLTRFLDNLTLEHSSINDFNQGVKFQTVVTDTNGSVTDGQVQLGAGGGSNWCSPSLSITALDLPKSGVANAVSAIAGQAFTGTGDNASGISFANVAITQPTSGNPSASILGTFDGYKTNAIFGEQGYTYLGTDTNSKEIVIVDLNNISSGKYVEVGYFNAPGNGSADTVFVSNNVGYMTSGNKLYRFDLSAKTGSRPQIGSGINLTAAAKKIVVIGSYAYLAIDSSTRQMEIVNLNSGQVVAYAAINGVEDGRDIFVKSDGSIIYLVTEYITGQPNFFVISVPVSPSGNLPSSQSFSTEGMNPKAVTVVTNNKAIIVGTGGYEYQVINLSDMSRCAQLNVDSGVNGVSSVVDSVGRAYSYIITGDASTEFKIIEGGPGGSVATMGIFESAVIDPCSSLYFICHNVGFNYFLANSFKPVGTTLEYQVAVASPVNNSCSGATYVFIGPDSLNRLGSRFSSNSFAIPYVSDIVGYQNPGRCLKYKAYFNSVDTSSTPYLYDVTVNFSP